MKIMCINCQNNKVNKHGGISSDGINNAKALAQYIIKNNYDLVGTQEMSVYFTDNLKKYLPNFNLLGKYRNDFPIINKIIPKLKEYKENNKIITKYKVIYERTIKLPWFPRKFKELKYSLKRKSLMRRIASSALLETEYGKIYMINTHLDYAIKDIQKKQLNKIYKHIYIVSKKYPIILTGDFNMEYNTDIFKEFIDKLNKINIRRIEINDKTNSLKHKNKTAIDHIFISNKFDIVNYGVIDDKDLVNMTDHKPIYVEVTNSSNN